MDSEIKVMVAERLDKIDLDFTRTNKNYCMNNIKFESIKSKLESIVSDEVKELVEELIGTQVDMNILAKEEIYKKAFKDGLTFKEYL
ncbi:Uncharacterised protein [uncultured Clostridium sp.]|nr:Uncharacterised protein [uncultured Clostridium sp.]